MNSLLPKIPAIIGAALLYAGLTFAPQPADQYVRKNDSPLKVVRGMVTQFKQRSSAAQIVLLGSSLMKSPMWRVDKSHYKSVPDYAEHHEARYLQDSLAKDGICAGVANLAVDGSLCSDAYLITDKLLNGKDAPSLVIYGISPQALSGYFLSVSTETPVYRALATPSECVVSPGYFVGGITDWLNMTATQLDPIYRDRRVYQTFAIAQLQAMMGDTGAWGRAALNTTQLDPEAIFKAYVKPYMDKALSKQPSPDAEKPPADERVMKRLLESLAASDKLVGQQRAALKGLVSLAQKRHIYLLLVNMPESETHYKQTPPMTRQKFLSDLDKIRRKQGVSILDLSQKWDVFDAPCFRDGLHLNEQGGEKFVPLLVQWIEQNRQQCHLPAYAQR